MNVQKLIELLQQQNPDAQLYFHSDGWHHTLDNIVVYEDKDGDVIIGVKDERV